MTSAVSPNFDPKKLVTKKKKLIKACQHKLHERRFK